MKTCTVCNEEKELTEFHTTMKRGKPYTLACCKVCQNNRCKKNYNEDKATYNARSVNWMRNNHERWREICSKSSGAYYHKVSSPLADRAIRLFERMTNPRRERFAQAILNNPTRLWEKACRVYALDEWLGAYSGI